MWNNAPVQNQVIQNLRAAPHQHLFNDLPAPQLVFATARGIDGRGLHARVGVTQERRKVLESNRTVIFQDIPCITQRFRVVNPVKPLQDHWNKFRGVYHELI
ncbi:UNVERIFIED_CONTAM: hypothetical protein ABIC26_000477 [Paenibacillus sp. PvR008]